MFDQGKSIIENFSILGFSYIGWKVKDLSIQNDKDIYKDSGKFD